MPGLILFMSTTKADIIAQLESEISHLQGYKPSVYGTSIDIGLGTIVNSFPNATFPLGAIHEFVCSRVEESAATSGFIARVISTLMNDNRNTLWISSARTLFPPALKEFGIHPEKIIFIDVKKEKDVLWAIEEALKCASLSAVVGEIGQLDFIASRRLQLAVEKSLVPGFIFHHNYRNQNTTASVTRWKIRPLPSESIDNLPGIAYPRWDVRLLKVRNGKPGSWKIEWDGKQFRHITGFSLVIKEGQKKRA